MIKVFADVCYLCLLALDYLFLLIMGIYSMLEALHYCVHPCKQSMFCLNSGWFCYVPLPPPWFALPLDWALFPSVEPWQGTRGGIGAGGPMWTSSLSPSPRWEAQYPAGYIQVAVFEVHALQRALLHFYNGILGWQTLAKVEAQEVSGCSSALAGFAWHPFQATMGQKVCLSYMPGSATNSENLYHEIGVFRDHFYSLRQVHVDQGNPKRVLACSASVLLHCLQVICSHASVSLMSFLLKSESVLQTGNSVSSLLYIWKSSYFPSAIAGLNNLSSFICPHRWRFSITLWCSPLTSTPFNLKVQHPDLGTLL